MVHLSFILKAMLQLHAGATELAQLFKNLGMPTSIDKVADTFMKFDRDESGQIEFSEFLLMFR
jgi:Ca2+-binding EF-hand superfamily protein